MSVLVVDMRGPRLKKTACPSCGKVLDAASRVTDDVEVPSRPVTPKPGDLAICNRCGAVNRYDIEGQLEPQPLDELDAETLDIIRKAQEAKPIPDGRAPRGKSQ